MALAGTYDAINTAIFLPSGGSGWLRQTLVDVLGVSPGHRVLELGCGTGQVTERLVRAGAEVIAVDALQDMLTRARRRAPGATFIEGDVLEAAVEGPFDRVVLSFLLHSFDVVGRASVLRRSAGVLAPGGRVGVLDWSLPSGGLRARAWRQFLKVLEPSPTVEDILSGALKAELPAAGLGIVSEHRVAGGRAQILVAEPVTRR